MSKELIRLVNCQMAFDDEIVLDDINLYFNDKEFLTLLGPSGCGKTTTLRIIGGFIKPTSGDVLFDGERINDVPPHKRKVNTVFQKYALFPHLDVYENVAFGLRLAKLPEPESVTQVPSCAIEGTDNVHNYGSFELTAFDDGSGEVIYSIYLLAPSAMTPEGLTLGDEAGKVTEAFGEDYELDGNAYLYTSGRTQLSIIVQNDTVVSIEYRLIVE